LTELGIPVIADLPVGDNLMDHYSTGMSFKADQPIGIDIPTEISPVTILAYELFKNNVLTNNLGECTGYVKTKYADPNVDYPDVQLFLIPG
jgi:hypothetical protein